MVDETIFKDGSEIDLILLDPRVVTDDYPDGSPIPFITNGVTRMELTIGCDVFNSDDHGITWNNAGGVKIKVGMDSALDVVAENIDHTSSLKVFDTLFPNGQTLISPRRKNANLTLNVYNTCN